MDQEKKKEKNKLSFFLLFMQCQMIYQKVIGFVLDVKISTLHLEVNAI